MSSFGQNPKDRKFEELIEKTKQAEKTGDLEEALQAWKDLGELCEWFVENQDDNSKKPVLEQAQSRAQELESKKRQLRKQRENQETGSGTETGADDSEEDNDHVEDSEARHSNDETGSDGFSPSRTGTGSEAQGFYEKVNPQHGFSDIGGFDDVKQTLNREIKGPFTNPDLYEDVLPYTITGVLLYGPPGTGKTYISKALANEMDAAFLYVRGSNITDKYLGESEKNIRRLIDEAVESQPAIIFIDELDTIAKDRSGDNDRTGDVEVLNELLSRLEEMTSEDVLMIGTSNRPWALDEAAVRSGRFEQHFYIGLPDRSARQQILRKMLSDLETDDSVTPGFVRSLVERTDGYTPSDLRAILRRAGIQAGWEDRAALSAADLKHGFSDVTPTVDMDRWGPVEEGRVDPEELLR